MVPREVMLRGLNLIHSPGMLSVTEANFLYDTAAEFNEALVGVQFTVWVELGVWCGRSFWAAGCGLPSTSVIWGYDLFDGRIPRREGSDEIAELAPPNLQWNVACAVAQSVEGVQKSPFRSCLSRKDSASAARDTSEPCVDVLVVDAAHDYESVRCDLEAWLPKMKPGGLIIGHDYGGAFEGVTRAFDERFGDKCEKIPGTRFVRVQL